MAFRMIFGADVCPTMVFQEGFIRGDIDGLIDYDLQQVLFSADFRCYNLEAPLADNYVFVEKYGPKICAGTNTLPGILSLRPSVVSICNNHITDAGDQGVQSTMHALEKVGIPFFGAGRNAEQAKNPYFLTIGSLRIGLIAFVEHFSAFATEIKAGANAFDLLESFEDIKALKEECDYVIVIYHGGKEYYQYPTPRLQKLCRKMVNYGADVVLCQHSHCVGCEEKYHDGTIIYGQGNFFFDSDMEIQQFSVLAQCSINEAKQLEFIYIPIVRDGDRMVLAKGEVGKKIISDFKERSLLIKDTEFLMRKFIELCESKQSMYVRWLIGNKVFIKIMDKLSRGKYSRNYYSKSEARRALIAISCDSHRELVEGMLNQTIHTH